VLHCDVLRGCTFGGWSENSQCRVIEYHGSYSDDPTPLIPYPHCIGNVQVPDVHRRALCSMSLRVHDAAWVCDTEGEE
jgi:hypothetical protein